jgi:cyanophycin synthetase
MLQTEYLKTYRGPNVFSSRKLIEGCAAVADGTVASAPASTTARLLAWLPGLARRKALDGTEFTTALSSPTGLSLAELLALVSLELQALAGATFSFYRTPGGGKSNEIRFLFEFEEEETGKAAARLAISAVDAALTGQEFDLPAELEKLQSFNYDIALGPSTRAIVNAAAARGVPFSRMNEGSLVRLGWGCKQRRVLTAETDRTPAVAEYIAQDKELTRALLLAMGIPAPQGRPVTDADDAWLAAQQIGVPVVVKPQFGNHGRGVTTNLWTKADVTAAYAAAQGESSSGDVIVERYALGGDYRLLVVGNRLVAAAHREPPFVVGDGQHTIRQLVEEINRDPRRSDDHATVLTRIRLCPIAEAVLAGQGFTFDSVPPVGVKVAIRNNANLSVGGTASDVTATVHPSVASHAIAAAKMIGLDIAGIDIIAEDIANPLEDQGGVIVEVNAGPGLRMHLAPTSGQPQPVGKIIADMLFPAGETGRIPVVSITGVNGKTTTTRLIAHLVRSTGKQVGYTCSDGVYLNDRRLSRGDCSGPMSAAQVFANPQVEAAVLETARGGILRAGLGYDRSDVGVVTNIGEGDHLGLNGIDTLEQLAKVKRVIIENVSPQGYGVLKADDPLTAAMAHYCPGRIIYFCQDAAHGVIEQHCEAGGRAVVARQGMIMLVEGDVEIPLVPLAKVPITHNGRIGFQVENALAATAAVWGLGLSRDQIRHGLETFDADLESSHGRFNLLEIGGATVIVDYGHNVSALESLIDAIEQFPASRRSVVYTAAGDRRDEDIVRQGELLGDAFDSAILFEDHYTRGRADGEIMQLIKRGLATGSRLTEITEVRGAISAVELGLRTIQPGDLMLIQADEVDETIEFIQRYLAADPSNRKVILAQALAGTPQALSTASAVD